MDFLDVRQKKKENIEEVEEEEEIKRNQKTPTRSQSNNKKNVQKSNPIEKK